LRRKIDHGRSAYDTPVELGIYVDDDGHKAQRHELLVFDQEAALLDRIQLAGKGTHFRAILRAGQNHASGRIQNGAVGSLRQLRIGRLSEFAGAEQGRAGSDFDAFILPGDEAAGAPGAETNTAALRIFDERAVIENGLAGFEVME